MTSNIPNDDKESSKKPDIKKKVFSDLKFPLPSKDISFDKNFEMISAYVVGSSYGKNPVGYKELAPYVSFNAVAISGSNKFLEHIGIIQNYENSQRYIPTKLAIDIHNATQWKNDVEKKSLLRKALHNSWFWTHARQLLEIQKSMKKYTMIEKLGQICMANPKVHARPLSIIVEYLKYSELLIDDNDELTINPSVIDKEEHHVSRTADPQKIDEKSTDLLDRSKVTLEERNDNVIKLIHKGSTPEKINFNIMINPGMSEEEIRKTVRIVLDELKKNTRD